MGELMDIMKSEMNTNQICDDMVFGIGRVYILKTAIQLNVFAQVERERSKKRIESCSWLRSSVNRLKTMFKEKAKEEKMKEERNKLPESAVPTDIRWDIMYTMGQIMLLIATLIFVTAALVAPSSAATNANIVITEVTPTELSPGDIKEVTLIVKNQGGGDALPYLGLIRNYSPLCQSHRTN